MGGRGGREWERVKEIVMEGNRNLQPVIRTVFIAKLLLSVTSASFLYFRPTAGVVTGEVDILELSH
jgi:hypothetical protein